MFTWNDYNNINNTSKQKKQNIEFKAPKENNVIFWIKRIELEEFYENVNVLGYVCLCCACICVLMCVCFCVDYCYRKPAIIIPPAQLNNK